MHPDSSRRRFLGQCAAAATAASLAPSFAWAQGDGYPSRPIRIVVGYPPGQTVDTGARALSIALTEILGKPVFVDNKAGANGILGAQDVRNAAPDGYTLLLGTSGQLAINPSIYAKPGYDPVKDFAPVMLNGVGRLYVVVPAASPFHTLADLVAYARPIRASSTTVRAGAASRPTSRWRCSRRRPAPTSCTCPTRARRPRSPT